MPHELLLQQLVDHLKPVHGLKAIVLGGSYASGGQRPDSDIDIGLYYNETYYLSEKKLAADLRAFRLRPEHFLERIYTLLGATGTTSAQLQESLLKTETLYSELSMLAGERRG